MSRLGLRQLDLLAAPGSPLHLLLAGGPVAQSLADRGLLSIDGPEATCAAYRITPAGLRRLAAAIESGELAPLVDPAHGPRRPELVLRDRNVGPDCGPIGEGG